MLTRRGLIVTAAGLGAAAAAGYASWPSLEDYERLVERQRRLMAADPGIADMIRMATLAANGHNTQPWLFEIGESQVTLAPDYRRSTPVVDPDHHHLFVSLGCAAENFVLAAAAAGYRADTRILGGDAPRIEVHLERAAPAASPLYRAIPLRQSTRAAFDGQPVSPDDLRLLAAAAAVDGVAVDIRTDARDLEAILDFVIAANTRQMEDPAFVEELRAWIRFTPDQAIASGDGLFAAASGNPVMPAWLASRLFEAFFTTDAENEKYRAHLRSSAGVAIFTAEASGPEHWMRVGRSFQRFALQATALDIRNAHVNQPIEVIGIRSEFARWLGIPGRRPDLVVRFGRGGRLPMSLRRPPGEVIRPA